MQDRIARTMRMKLRKIKNGKIKLVSHDARYSYNPKLGKYYNL